MTLVLLVAVPLAAGAGLALGSARLGGRLAGALVTAALAFSFGIAGALAQAFAAGATSLVAEGGAWLPIRGSGLALRAEPLSVPLILLITGVAALIAFASLGERWEDRVSGGGGGPRYFATFALLAFALLLVVLARDLVLLLAGWGLVGLFAALLIAHRREGLLESAAGRTAFVVARLSDAALLIAVFAFLGMFHTTDVEQIAARLGAITLTADADRELRSASLLVVVAALARSAQPPFQRWLTGTAEARPGAAALVQSLSVATGAVLLLRLAPILHPTALLLAAAAGAAAAILGGLAALAQHDMRRVLAWSTVSQVGLMFAAAGSGSMFLAFFALVAHSLGKTSLVLGAGALERATDGETDLRRLGGIAQTAPLFVPALIPGALGLAAAVPAGGALRAVGMSAAVLTGAYLARLLWLTLGGAPRRTDLRAERPSLPSTASAIVAGLGALAFAGLTVTGPVDLPGARPADLGAALAMGLALAASGAFATLVVYRRGPRVLLGDRAVRALASGLWLERASESSLVAWSRALARLVDLHGEHLIAGASEGIGEGAMRMSRIAVRAGDRYAHAAEALLVACLVALIWYWSRG